MIGKCGATIFVFGEADISTPEIKSGVWEEFLIAKQQHKTIIPIAYPNMVSEKIWIEVKSHLTQYPYLEKTIDLLKSTQQTGALAELIVHILNSVRDSV